jgi:Fe-Mn family superoxide dismutase
VNETYYQLPDLTYDYGALEPHIKRQDHGAAATVQGAGWALAASEPVAGGIVVQQVSDHQGNHGQGTIPLLAVDARERADYLRYLDAKGDFFDAVWQVVNWADVAERLTAARRPEA